MTYSSSAPNLLYTVVEGWTSDEVRKQFGRRRITVEACKSAPAWSRAFDGQVFEVQTLYGEYGGFVGSSVVPVEDLARTTELGKRHSQVDSSTKLSATKQLERDDSVRKMLEVLRELTQRGRVVLYLSIPSLETRPSSKSGVLSAECLLQMAPNVPFVFERQMG